MMLGKNDNWRERSDLSIDLAKIRLNTCNKLQTKIKIQNVVKLISKMVPIFCSMQFESSLTQTKNAFVN